ncbi:hypothetical protein RHSIM_Rhsim06G0084200 [Rhododendron simsii]|uniref:Integrase zinc-binding domain-containing protein n=1 Tax=Rhododendron simsii TaxID=118357 RepID=A0A834LL94_RHOSS|nr:hypothetical protein RHSIM_Rhsim06G0084200 [Rhododendron simsii]
MPCFVTKIFPEEEIENWRTPIANKLKCAFAAITLSNLKHFTIYQGVLYYRGSRGLLARCIGEEDAKVKIQEVHERSCGTGDVTLYRQLQCQGYYWPTMATDAVALQSQCPKCREIPSKVECNFIEVYSDWRKPYIDFLTEGTLPPDRVDMAIFKKRAPKFFIHNEELFRRSFEGKPLKCLAGLEISKALEVAHEAEHQGRAKLFQHLLHVGYYWPTMEEDVKNHVKRCKACHVHGNMIHAPAVDLRAIGTPWPFHTWGMDLIGPINPPSKGNIWILMPQSSIQNGWRLSLSKGRQEQPSPISFESTSYADLEFPKPSSSTMAYPLSTAKSGNSYSLLTSLTTNPWPIILKEMGKRRRPTKLSSRY